MRFRLSLPLYSVASGSLRRTHNVIFPARLLRLTSLQGREARQERESSSRQARAGAGAGARARQQQQQQCSRCNSATHSADAPSFAQACVSCCCRLRRREPSRLATSFSHPRSQSRHHAIGLLATSSSPALQRLSLGSGQHRKRRLCLQQQHHQRQPSLLASTSAQAPCRCR